MESSRGKISRIGVVLGLFLTLVTGFVWSFTRDTAAAGQQPPATSEPAPPPPSETRAADESRPLPTMIEFHSDYCPVCKRMAPLIEALTTQCNQRGVRIVRHDVSNPELEHLVEDYRLVGLPTYLFLDRDGKEVARLVGLQTEIGLLQSLSAVRGEPCPQIGMLPPNRSQPSRSTPSSCSLPGEARAPAGECTGS